jgi:putative hydrolase of the HAD superfamily
MIKAIIFDCFGVMVSVRSERNERMIDFVRSLRGLYKIGLLSNVINRHSLDERFHPDELNQLFDTVIASGDVGLEKPDAGIYELAAHQLDVKPEECLFIDDILDFCHAAERVGMQSIHCQNIDETIDLIKQEVDFPHEN